MLADLAGDVDAGRVGGDVVDLLERAQLGGAEGVRPARVSGEVVAGDEGVSVSSGPASDEDGRVGRGDGMGGVEAVSSPQTRPEHTPVTGVPLDECVFLAELGLTPERCI